MRAMSVSLAALLLAGCGAKPEAAGQAAAHAEAVVETAADDAEMDAAVRQAQSGLDEFLSLAAAPPAGTSDFALKAGLVDPNGTEQFWFLPFERTATGFRGVLVYEPQLVQHVKQGQTIEFTRAQVSDWGYIRDGKKVGNFTDCVMLKRTPKEEADRIRQEHGFEC